AVRAVRIGGAAAPADEARRGRRGRLPQLEARIGDRGAVAVEHAAGELEPPPARAERGEIPVAALAGQVPERPDGLAGGDRAPPRAPCAGVAWRPRSTMSKRNPSAHSGWVRDRSNAEISRPRASASGTDWKIGSIASSGSPGKYIWVT